MSVCSIHLTENMTIMMHTFEFESSYSSAVGICLKYSVTFILLHLTIWWRVIFSLLDLADVIAEFLV